MPVQSTLAPLQPESSTRGRAGSGKHAVLALVHDLLSLCNRLRSTSGRLQEFTRSSILAFECNWSEASLERELADHPECGLFCCIVWLTLLQLPRKTVTRFQLPSSGVGAGAPRPARGFGVPFKPMKQLLRSH